MTLKSPTLVFFGSGPVAAASLAYIAEHFNVELVVTKRRPVHHKDPAPVETLAAKQLLPVAYADTKHELDILLNTTQFASTVGVVIDYGVIISSDAINKFEHGIINSHFSLLPDWRGADPITYSLLSGQTQTGVSLMTIDKGLDTGAIIAEAPVTIDPIDTNQSLTLKLVDTSNALIGAVLIDYLDGTVVAVPQKNMPITYSRKLTKADGTINWNKPAPVLEREIRAFSEWPKSRTTIGLVDVIITGAVVVVDNGQPGLLQITDDKKLIIGTKVGSLCITELMPLGKQKMTAAAFLNGYGSRLT